MSELYRLDLELELLTDVCLSTSNRTLGQPETFDHLPGRSLWGAVAGLAYRSGAADEAFRLFHQGGVRFLDGLPMGPGGRSCPVPRSWHQEKGAATGSILNFALREVREEATMAAQQFKPTRDEPFNAGGSREFKPSWVTPGDCFLKVPTTFSLRTSVDRSGKAREGLLFGLPAICAGSRFGSALLGSREDVERVATLLKGQDLRLGRSSQAEMGLVRVHLRREGTPQVGSGEGVSNRVSFLCVSRCILRDLGTGAPTLIPTPTLFGLDQTWTWDESLSFIRTARIVHFNAKRGRPERERYALERGSVVTFTTPGAGVLLEEVSQKTSGGVGEHRGEGYGEVLVGPRWLVERTFTPSLASEAAKPAAAPEPQDELFRWARTQSRERRRAVDMYREAVELAPELRAKGVPPAQWGTLRRMAREARFRGREDALLAEVKKHVEHGKRKLSKAWKKAAPRLIQACEQQGAANLPQFLEQLAGACMRPAAGQAQVEENR